MANMIKTLHGRMAATLFYPTAAASALAVGLVLVRSQLTGILGPNFLVWNLFLAWIPYLMALWAVSSARRSLWRALVPAALWLLFLPNAPYLMTDLIHLERFDFVWWFDMGMLLAFAWAGCMLGVASLFVLQRLVAERFGAALSWAFVLASCGLSGLGVYVGRFLRWNSWDVLFSPRSLLYDLTYLLGSPDLYPQIIGVSGLFACFLGLGYLTLAAVRRA